MDLSMPPGVDWPSQPIEQIPPEDFCPPHCRWQECPTRGPGDHTGFRFRRHAKYLRKSDQRVVPRFRCMVCRRTFSLQTFAFSYYLKRPELAVPVADKPDYRSSFLGLRPQQSGATGSRDGPSASRTRPLPPWPWGSLGSPGAGPECSPGGYLPGGNRCRNPGEPFTSDSSSHPRSDPTHSTP